MFNQHQQAMLKAAAATKDEKTLNNVIEMLKTQDPRKFQTLDSVEKRDFYHQPRYPTPHRSFVMPFPPEVQK